MIDRDGVDGLSMRKLGAALGVEGMALYRHVGSKERVLDGVVEVLLAELELPAAESASWIDAWQALARSYRQIAHRHRGAFRLLALSPLTTAQRFERAQAPLAILRAAGFSDTAAQRAFRTLLSYADGYLLRELTDRDAESDAQPRRKGREPHEAGPAGDRGQDAEPPHEQSPEDPGAFERQIVGHDAAELIRLYVGCVE